jgi:hypothetical protein
MSFAQRTLASLAVVAMFGLMTSSAFANINLTYNATDVGTAATTGDVGPVLNTLVVGATNVGNFTLALLATTNDPSGGTTSLPGNSTLSSVTITILNTGKLPSPDTLNLFVTGQDFSLLGNLRANFTIQGTTGTNSSSADTMTAQSWVSTTNTLFGGSPHAAPGTGTEIPPAGGLTGVPSSFAPSVSYNFADNGNSGNLFFSNGSTFSLTQLFAITLAAGDAASFTLSTTVTPSVVPEPSTMALAGLGALGLIGYGLRRRKASGA